MINFLRQNSKQKGFQPKTFFKQIANHLANKGLDYVFPGNSKRIDIFDKGSVVGKAGEIAGKFLGFGKDNPNRITEFIQPVMRRI